ncbi:MAG TPA: HAD domain-containing protein [Candidatus Sulfotelmatobacter sp.]|nr:HAD domain-containing protein [Candidatus Sulfotelmatobacter sp.]
MKPSDALLQAMQAAEKAVLAGEPLWQIYGDRAGSPPVAPWPKEPCKVVFLDFDGVLNSEQSVERFGTRYRFAKENVTALNEILRLTDARLVITSSWREGLTLREMIGFLERDGVLPVQLAGKTKSLEKERGLEIDGWLRSVPYPVSSFAILDDRDDMAMHHERLVQVNSQTGLSMAQAQLAIKLLAKPWKGNV